jgi:Rieske Fe-S protein
MGLAHAIRPARVLGLAAVTASMVVVTALPASAAPPSHDTIDGAKVISEVPFSEIVDTTEATTDAEDAAINTNCGAPATNGSVWYSLTASGSAAAYLVDVSQSDFTAGVIVATGTPGNLSLVTCGPQSVGFEVTPGTTYFLMAFSDNPDVVGGQLSISVTEASPPPKVSMTINEVGRVNTKTGAATVSGTYTCDGQADFTVLQGRLSQKQGDIHVVGNFEQLDLPCGGTFKWSATIAPESGKFKRGEAASLALVAACNQLGCNVYETLDVLRLRGGG